MRALIASIEAQGPSTYVFVRGAWGGSWDWRRVEADHGRERSAPAALVTLLERVR